MGVDGLTSEMSGKVRVSRIPMVAVCHDQRVKVTAVPVLGEDRPTTSRPPLGGHDAVLEADVALQVKLGGIALEIVLDLRMMREIRVLVWDGKVPE